MPFKIPIFDLQPGANDNQMLFGWLRTFFSRLSKSDLILERELSIGDWDMDATASVTVEYKQGSDAFNVGRLRGFNIVIFKDDGVVYEGVLGLDSVTLNTTNITITRTAGGIFDNTDFNDTTILTRGYVTIRFST